jgi:hypothetical protein
MELAGGVALIDGDYPNRHVSPNGRGAFKKYFTPRVQCVSTNDEIS